MPLRQARKARLCSIHLKVYAYQHDWLRRQRREGVGASEIVRAAIDDYIDKIKQEE